VVVLPLLPAGDAVTFLLLLPADDAMHALPFLPAKDAPAARTVHRPPLLFLSHAHFSYFTCSFRFKK
jgi:hypothetical protein